MTWLDDLETGLAQRTETIGAGTWRPSDSTGSIYLGAIPPEVDTGVGIHTYGVGADSPDAPSAQRRAQFWLRGVDAHTLNTLAQAIYDGFHGLTGADFGAAHVTQMLQLSDLPQGVDGSGHPERALNFTLDLDLPSTALRSY